MGKTILFGEPMALLIADTTGPLEEVEHFTRAMSGAEVNVSIGLSRLISPDLVMIHLDIILQVR